jgi:hypothetical protein
MAGKLSPGAQVRLATLNEFVARIQHVHGLVEHYAAAKTNPEAYLQAMSRAFSRLKLELMGAGFDSMSQLSGAMEIASKRGLSQAVKVRILREGVGSLKFQMELEQRSVLSDEAAAARKKDDAAGTTD